MGRIDRGGVEEVRAPMYRRLPLGPHGMTREDVARNQRTRLYGGMIKVVAERGYQASTVSSVIGLAGVSRRAFYEQYTNKEECFLATHDILVARFNKLALEAWEKERGWANRVHAAFKAVLDDCVASPTGPHLVLVDSLGIGPRARERMQLVAAAQESMLTAAFDSAPDGIKLPPLTAKAIVGGMRHVLFTRLHQHREQELLTMTDELLDWISAYRSPLGAKLDAIVPSEPPEVPMTQAAFLASEDARARTLHSVMRLTREEGYAGLTDPQIAQCAGTSTEAFHKQFSSKQECFLAVVDELTREAAEAVRGCMGSASSWSEAVRLAVGAFTEFFAARPELIRMAFVDLFEVGPAITGRLTGTIESLTRLLDETGPDPRRAPEIAAEAITGGLWAVLSSCAANDRLSYLPCLTDHITFVVLAPYVGAKQAMQTIEAGRREESPKAA